MNKKHLSTSICLLLLSVLSLQVHAHTGNSSIHSFGEGLLHPWLGIDHVLAMSAIGLWAAVLGGHSLWMLPINFLFAMVVGAMLSHTGTVINGMEIWVAFSVLTLGLVLTMNRRMSPLLVAGLVSAFALGHGYVHAAEMAHNAEFAGYALGFFIATMVLHGLGMVAGLFGPIVLQTVRTVFALICALAGMVLLAGF